MYGNPRAEARVLGTCTTQSGQIPGLTVVVVTNNMHLMKAKKRSTVSVPVKEEVVFVELIRTADVLSRGLVQLMKSENISPTQYNVLRILRGSQTGLPCGEIGDRMLTRDPDITRLLDRLEKRNFIIRWRDAHDRRTVLSLITPQGLELLERLDGPVQEIHRRQLGHLHGEQLSHLVELLRIARYQGA